MHDNKFCVSPNAASVRVSSNTTDLCLSPDMVVSLSSNPKASLAQMSSFHVPCRIYLLRYHLSSLQSIPWKLGSSFYGIKSSISRMRNGLVHLLLNPIFFFVSLKQVFLAPGWKLVSSLRLQARFGHQRVKGEIFTGVRPLVCKLSGTTGRTGCKDLCLLYFPIMRHANPLVSLFFLPLPLLLLSSKNLLDLEDLG